MELVRYRPGEAIRWLQTGGESIRRDARQRGKIAVRGAGSSGADARAIGDNLKSAASAVFDFGRGAYADLKHRQAEANEYVLHDEHLDIVRGGNLKSVRYADIRRVQVRGDRATLELERGNVTIRPFAHIVAGRVKVPVGWVRNGIEVPYELLLEELAARCGCEIDAE